MSVFIFEYYDWFKAFHVIAIISWMVGLLYLPRLFVYHAEAAPQSEVSETLKIMEHRLLRFIMNPAMIVTWGLGLILLFGNIDYLKTAGWMHAKLTAVVLLTIMHMVFARYRKNFARDANAKPAKFYRILNEVPTVLMIFIVIMALAEPF